MPSWLLATILVGSVSMFWLCLIGAMLIKFAKSEKISRTKFEKAMKLVAEKQKLLDECGFREIDLRSEE